MLTSHLHLPSYLFLQVYCSKSVSNCSFSRTCHVHATYMSRTCHVHATYMPRTCHVHATYMSRTHTPHPIKLFKLITFYCFFIRISGTDVKWATAVRILSSDILIHISWLGVSCQWDHKGTHVDALINDIHFNYRELITRPLKLALERWVVSQVNKQIFPRRGLL